MTAATHTPRGRLRILGTTDLHMHLLPYDYFADRVDERLGLTALADLISELRAANDGATLLFDNGDFLQGNPLADTVAATLGTADIHPMIAAMNNLRYDAITLGNHEFDYGLAFLRRSLAQATAAVVSANIHCADGPALAAQFQILTRDLPCDDGVTRPVRIGVTGFAPPQIADKVGENKAGQITVADIVSAAKRTIPDMQRAGADVIIALCHSGIGAAQAVPMMENAALPLALQEGLDALLIGHSHEVFPDPERMPQAAVDPVHGTLHAKPAVMAGFYGTSLGVIDLDLGWTKQGWTVQQHTTSLQKPTTVSRQKSPQRREIEAVAAPAHAATLRYMRKPVARNLVPIQNYFATIQPDLSMQLLAQAMRDAVSAKLREGPVLAAVSPFRSGGRNGPGHYIDIPVGQLTLRDAAAIFPFADTLCAVRRTGAQIKSWLERAASHYNEIRADMPHQPLLNPHSANYNCDALYGLVYEVDLTRPARFDACGNEVAPHARRIRHVTYEGRAVADDDVFIVATNSFRAKGGGGFAQIPQADIQWDTGEKLRDILVRSLRSRGQISDAMLPVWRFRPIAGAQPQFQTAPQARQHLPKAITHLGPGQSGFETFCITL